MTGEMESRKENQWIHRFRLAAALMVVAIHIGPFGGVSETADYLITYCLFRVAVPFFLMVAGYFVLSAPGQVGNYVSKMIRLYVFATILYLPINWYAGKQIGGITGVLRDIFLDGTFYHLWYFPAVMLGCLIVMALIRLCGELQTGIIVSILYIAGTLGDSYGGLVMGTDIGRNFYDQIFSIGGYTRNGFFYAPMFLWMGVMSRRKKGRTDESGRDWPKDLIGFGISLLLMLAEGALTYEKGWQRHNSMYFALPLAMYFLFSILLSRDAHSNPRKGTMDKKWRGLSLWIYLLHPLCIILVRGMAKAVGMTKVLVENTVVHYVAVCVISVGVSAVVCLLVERIRHWKGKGRGKE